MKTRCVSSGASVVPFFYPSVSRKLGDSPNGCFEVGGEVALSN